MKTIEQETPRSMQPKSVRELPVPTVPLKDLDYGLIVREIAEQASKIGQSFIDKGNKLFANVCKAIKSRSGMAETERLDAKQESQVRDAIDTFKHAMANRVLDDYQFNFKARFDKPVVRFDKLIAEVTETAWGASVSGERGHKDRLEARFAATHHLEQARRRLVTMEETPAKYDAEAFQIQRKKIKALEKHRATFDTAKEKKAAKAEANGATEPVGNGAK